MMGGWKLSRDRDEVLCLDTDFTGAMLFRFGVVGSGFFIREIKESKEGCEK
jgi:hypothetical protein